MSALRTIETPVVATDARRAARSEVASRERSLRLAGAWTPALTVPAARCSAAAAQPRSSSIADSAGHRPPALTGPVLTGTVVTDRGRRFGSTATTQGTRVPLRLTRRGRIVVGVLLVAVFSVAVLLATALVSGGAQATNHGQPRAGYQGMHAIVVRPGQTLWSIAASADPAADPRNVVQEIMTANALGSPSITAGQLLWVP
jgi:hypothetical protein